MYTGYMKKIIFGIFAHPDDEAFGPAGTLLSEVKSGAELHLVSFSAGQNGQNPDSLPNLREVRLGEWRESGRLLGAKGMYHLGFTDGQIGNMAMLEAVGRIKKLVREVVSAEDGETVEVEFITMDLNGVTGHIDHIAVSRAAHHAYYDLQSEGLPLARLRLNCLPLSYTGDKYDTGFVFMEPGRTPVEVDEVVDSSRYRGEVINIMRAHYTQRWNCEAHLSRLGDKVAIDHFIVKT